MLEYLCTISNNLPIFFPFYLFFIFFLALCLVHMSDSISWFNRIQLTFGPCVLDLTEAGLFDWLLSKGYDLKRSTDLCVQLMAER